MSQTSEPTYATFARAVRKYPRTELLARVAAMAAEEAKLRTTGHKSKVPVLWFSLAGVARAGLAESRDQQRSTSRRRSGVSQRQVERLCHMYLTVYDPPRGGEVMPSILTRVAFEQYPAQVHPTANIDRGYLLFKEYADRFPAMPTQDEWEDLQGVSVDAFLRIGFALYLGAISFGGTLTPDLLRTDQIRRLYEPLDPETVLRVVHSQFAQTAAQHRHQTRQAERAGQQKWSFNPLASRPLIRHGDTLVCPSPQYVLDRISAAGLWYPAAAEWGGRFTTALGEVFETYVGDQLRLIAGAQVIQQVHYTENGSDARSSDWFVVTNDVLLIVDVKCARPIQDYRSGDTSGLADTSAKVNAAVGQLERTARHLASNHPAFSHIPKHLPIRGLIVTLEPFYIRETMREDLVLSNVLPIGMLSSYELELCAAALTDQPDAGAQILAALTRSDQVMPTLSDVTNGRDKFRSNEILTRGWKNWATWATNGRRAQGL